jgi:hypothetical protein
MDIVEGERQYGPIGAANVALVGKVLQIVMTESGEIFNLSADALPEGVKKIPSGQYKVSLSADKKKIYELYPLNGSVNVEFVGFAKKQGQPPFPRPPTKRTGVNRQGQEYPKDWLEYKVLCRIVDGPYKGLTVGFKLRYYFAVGKDGTHAAVSGTGKHSQLIARFLDCATGDIGKVRVVFSDNILPPLETLLLREVRPFVLIIENGWVNTIAAGFETARRRAPHIAKKAAKKTAKKAVKKKK